MRVNQLLWCLVCLGFLKYNVVLAQNVNNDNLPSPWGGAQTMSVKYKPHKLLYDVTTSDPKKLINILDRVSYLFKLYESDMFESSIVIIIHGNAIPFFAIDQFTRYKQTMKRAYNLTVSTTIEFRMCKAAAAAMHYQAKDIHGFVKMIPMADAEIVRLQQEEGYAYMR